MKKIQVFLISIMGLIFIPLVQAGTLPGALVETDWLANNMDKVVILDVRKDVKSFTKKPVFKKDKKSGKSKLKKLRDIFQVQL